MLILLKCHQRPSRIRIVWFNQVFFGSSIFLEDWIIRYEYVTCMYYVNINIFCFLYMLILTVFGFSLEVFPLFPFFPVGKTRWTAPRWFTRIAPRVWPGNPQFCEEILVASLPRVGSPKTLRSIHGGYNEWGWLPSNKNDGIHWNSTPLPGIKWGIKLDAKCCWWFWGFFSQIISAWSLGHMDVS